MSTKTNNYKKAIFLYFALSILLTSDTYFQWDSYDRPIIALILQLFRYSGLFIMFIGILLTYKNFRKIKLNVLILGIFLILTFIEMNLLGTTYHHIYNLSNIIAFLTFLVCILLTDADRSQVFEYLMKFFAIAAVPSLIYYILTRILGISISWSYLGSDNLGKVARGMSYELRPFGLIIRGVDILPRICGIYDEPGVIGSVAAFLISINLLSSKNKKWTVLLLIEGIMSFSMAFYLLMFIVVLIIMVNKGVFKLAITMVAAVIAFNIFMNTEFDNPAIKNIQSRIDVSSYFLVSDNRTSSSFDDMYNEFIEDGGYAVVFGNGYNASKYNPRTAGSSSYKRVIYDYGFLGAAMFFGFFVLIYVLEYGANKYNLPFFLVFVASWYQRPYVMFMLYIALYITGLGYLAINKDERMYSRKKSQRGKRRWSLRPMLGNKRIRLFR